VEQRGIVGDLGHVKLEGGDHDLMIAIEVSEPMPIGFVLLRMVSTTSIAAAQRALFQLSGQASIISRK
jgi:hypothetical protein